MRQQNQREANETRALAMCQRVLLQYAFELKAKRYANEVEMLVVSQRDKSISGTPGSYLSNSLCDFQPMR